MMSARKQRKLLRDVSRSFYLSLRVLPARIRPQISLAYLLARASDTIADTQAMPRAERIKLLESFRHAIRQHAQREDASGSFSAAGIAREAATAGERRLLKKIDHCLKSLAGFSDVDRMLISELLDQIIAGQIFDLEKFTGTDETGIVALANEDELDRYTYLVAGSVGEFWTKMCMEHVRDLRDWNAASMAALGVRFGKALQIINILRDIARDLRAGRCYLPVSDPQSLLVPANFTRIEEYYQQLLDETLKHLDAGWLYTMQIPRSQMGLRLACIWPIWIGMKTIARLRKSNPLNPNRRIRISRFEVYAILLRSWLLCRDSAKLYRHKRKLHHAALGLVATRKRHH
jgi:farnesyl-diphosphate farnesyltransferase